MEYNVKIRGRVLPIADAAHRLSELGLQFAGIDPVLGIPYEIDFPFSAGARSKDDQDVIEIRGTYPALLELEREMRK